MGRSSHYLSKDPDRIDTTADFCKPVTDCSEAFGQMWGASTKRPSEELAGVQNRLMNAPKFLLRFNW
jgi:hypothetical protein